MESSRNALVSLTSLSAGTTCKLVKWGDLDPADIRKLTDVGIILGMPLKISSSTVSGPVVIAVNDAHVAISFKTAEQLLVLVRK